MKFLPASEFVLTMVAVFGLGACTTVREAANAPVANQVHFTGHYLGVEDADVRPQPRSMRPPRYPDDFRVAGVNGSAVIAFIVDTDGSVKEAQIQKASNQAFGEAALAAVKHWKYTPALKDGVAVPVAMSVPVEFSFGHGPAPDLSAKIPSSGYGKR